jgi:hypothetical protein
VSKTKAMNAVPNMAGTRSRSLFPLRQACSSPILIMAQLNDPKFEENVQQLQAIMADACSTDAIRKVLQKHNGNLEKALDALMVGDTGADDDIPPLEPIDTNMGDSTSSQVIDITNDDDQNMKRAIQMSMENNNVRFGPSTRSPDPNWQMTLSNVRLCFQ